MKTNARSSNDQRSGTLNPNNATTKGIKTTMSTLTPYGDLSPDEIILLNEVAEDYPIGFEPIADRYIEILNEISIEDENLSTETKRHVAIARTICEILDDVDYARRRIGARAHQLTEHEIAGIDSLATEVDMPIRDATKIYYDLRDDFNIDDALAYLCEVLFNPGQ